MRLFRIFSVFLLTIVCFLANAQEIKVSRLFAEHMVLQRDMAVRFWGSAGENQEVAITIDGYQIKTKSDAYGSWECLYPAQRAGGPFDVEISTSSDTRKIADVYFGDVWVASGQSNMEWKVKSDIDNMKAEIADSNYPLIRFFEVPKKVAPRPQKTIESGDWKIANPDNVGDFSAVGWFFAKHNHLEKGVPVGVIGSYWGGTPAEAWTSIDIVNGVEGYKEQAKELMDPTIDWDKKLADNEALSTQKWDMINDVEGASAYGVQKFDFDDSNWREVSLPNEEPLSDFAWVRKLFSLKNTNAAKLSLGSLTNLATVYVNGYEVFNRRWGLLPLMELSPEVLKKGENVVVVRTVNDWDNRVFIGKEGSMWVQQGKKQISLEGAWKYSNTIEPAMPKVDNYSWTPSFLYNGMIHPIEGYSLKGAIWYQGESNAGQNQFYRGIFGAMIQDWRVKWKQGNFPFLFVQLANWRERYDEPTDSEWAKLQEAQTQTLELPNTGMAVTIDIGDADDIHPRNKQDVGKRLWFAARKVAYGEDAVYSGPTYASQKVEGNTVTISFDNIGSGLVVSGEELEGFALAGEDMKFYWAKGTAKGSKVLLTSVEVPNPVYIRYAWADNPDCNLYNSEGLPAVPFRTDNKE